jgi:tetratricopeptide (TPR) repeat protein
MAMDERETGGAPPFQVTVEDLFVRGDHEAILALAEGRLAQWPDDPFARLAQCRVWIQQGKVEEAQSLLKDLEPLLVDLGRIYAALGDRFLKKGREEEARAYYRKTMFLSPDTPLPEDTLPSLAEEVPKAAARTSRQGVGGREGAGGRGRARGPCGFSDRHPGGALHPAGPSCPGRRGAGGDPPEGPLAGPGRG